MMAIIFFNGENVWCECGDMGTSYTADENEKWCNWWGKSVPPKQMQLSYDPAIPQQGIFPRKIKTYVLKKFYTHIFIAALFIIAKKWKTPNDHHWWMDKMSIN